MSTSDRHEPAPDIDTPGFAEDAHRQSALAATSSSAAEDQAWVDVWFPRDRGGFLMPLPA